jgi:hypothetical protein
VSAGRIAALAVLGLITIGGVFTLLYLACTSQQPAKPEPADLKPLRALPNDLVALPIVRRTSRSDRIRSALRAAATRLQQSPTTPPAGATQEVAHVGWEDTPDALTGLKERVRGGAHADPGTAAWPLVAHSTGKHAATEAMNPAEVARELARTSDLSDEAVAAIVREHHVHAGLPVDALDRRIAAAQEQGPPAPVEPAPAEAPQQGPPRMTWEEINAQNRSLREWADDPDRTGLMPRVDSYESAS